MEEQGGAVQACDVVPGDAQWHRIAVFGGGEALAEVYGQQRAGVFATVLGSGGKHGGVVPAVGVGGLAELADEHIHGLGGVHGR